jgi:hypothetical protein
MNVTKNVHKKTFPARLSAREGRIIKLALLVGCCFHGDESL